MTAVLTPKISSSPLLCVLPRPDILGSGRDEGEQTVLTQREDER